MGKDYLESTSPQMTPEKEPSHFANQQYVPQDQVSREFLYNYSLHST